MSNVFADVWVVIAAYNEGRAIELVLASLVDLPYRVVVVDDGSTDGTA
ncbi:glycosyltransferase, partial [Bradyrhizobium sp.]|nr:glycosyltransferase [Bradyrhizobium sp.]